MHSINTLEGAGRLRILQVLETSGGGSGRHVIDLTRALAARGHSVHVAWSPLRADPNFISELHEISHEFGVETTELNMKRNPGPSDLTALRQLNALIDRIGRIDIIHGHSSKAGALIRLANVRGAKRVYTPHALSTMDPELSKIKRTIYSRIERFLGRWRSDAIIAVSPSEAAACQALGIPGKRISVIINGVDSPEAPDPIPDGIRLPEGVLIVGFVGRFSSQKDPINAIKAFSLATKQKSDVVLVMLGSGPLSSQCHHLIEELGLEGRVLLLGQQPAMPFLSRFDLFLLSSTYEAMPYVLLEAQELGIPIVSTDVSGTEVVVENGINGIVSPPSNSVALSEALSEAIEPAKLKTLKEEAARRVGRRSVSAMATETDELYRTLNGSLK